MVAVLAVEFAPPRSAPVPNLRSMPSNGRFRESGSNDRDGRDPVRPFDRLPGISAREPRRSVLGALRENEGILDIDAKVADRALDLRVAEQDLHRTEIARSLVDE